MSAIEPWRPSHAVDTLSERDVLATAQKLAVELAGTEFVPKAFRGKPAAVMAAMLTGRELGIGPMAALQRIHVIDGRPCLDAQGQRALVLAAGHDLWIEEATPARAVACGRRAGSEHLQRVEWTMEMGRQAGLASKSNWRAFPRQMLVARATSELARQMAPDALQGLGYSREELEDEAPPAQPARTRKAATRDAATPVSVTAPPAAILPATTTPPTPAPSWDDDEPATPAPTDEVAIAKLKRQMHAVAKEHGITNEARKAAIYAFTGGRTDSSNDLDEPELRGVIEALREAPAADDDVTEAEIVDDEPAAFPLDDTPDLSVQPTTPEGWDGLAKHVGIRPALILKQARALAQQFSEPVPAAADQFGTLGTQTAYELHIWLLDQVAGQ